MMCGEGGSCIGGVVDCDGNENCLCPTEDYDAFDNELSNTEWKECRVELETGHYYE